MTNQVTLIDVGTGNLRSVQKALESLGALVNLTSDPMVLLRSRRHILPGVGAFGDFMHGLRERGLESPIREMIQRGDYLLGICVGMQALFEVSEEMGEHHGLGLLPGKVIRFPDFPDRKVPHTGWNQLAIQSKSPLLVGISTGDFAYFNHTYYCQPEDSKQVLTTTEYGHPFASAIHSENFYGVQFHPEKSQRTGLQVLKNFLSLGQTSP